MDVHVHKGIITLCRDGGEEYKDGMEGERIERGREESRGSFITLYIRFRDEKGPR